MRTKIDGKEKKKNEERMRKEREGRPSFFFLPPPLKKMTSEKFPKNFWKKFFEKRDIKNMPPPIKK